MHRRSGSRRFAPPGSLLAVQRSEGRRGCGTAPDRAAVRGEQVPGESEQETRGGGDAPGCAARSIRARRGGHRGVQGWQGREAQARRRDDGGDGVARGQVPRLSNLGRRRHGRTGRADG